MQLIFKKNNNTWFRSSYVGTRQASLLPKDKIQERLDLIKPTIVDDWAISTKKLLEDTLKEKVSDEEFEAILNHSKFADGNEGFLYDTR